MPSSALMRSLVHPSSSKIASRSSGAATQSNRPTAGNLLGTSRVVPFQRIWTSGGEFIVESRGARWSAVSGPDCGSRAAACGLWTASAASRVQEAPDAIQAVDTGVDGPRQGRSASEQRIGVRHPYPAVRHGLLGVENLEALVDAENERHARQRVECEGSVVACLVLMVGRSRRPSEQGALLCYRQVPGAGDVEESPEGRPRKPPPDIRFGPDTHIGRFGGGSTELHPRLHIWRFYSRPGDKLGTKPTARDVEMALACSGRRRRRHGAPGRAGGPGN